MALLVKRRVQPCAPTSKRRVAGRLAKSELLEIPIALGRDTRDTANVSMGQTLAGWSRPVS
jgi:hypothetical protein